MAAFHYVAVMVALAVGSFGAEEHGSKFIKLKKTKHVQF